MIEIDEKDNGFCTNKSCWERREALKNEAWARAEAIKLATEHRDDAIKNLERRIDALDSRINGLILLILIQLISLFAGLFALLISGKL